MTTMTERLYYTDAYLRTFDATVVACTPAGERCEVLLDRTAFYPTSGGQPFDVGTLGGARVLDVIDREDGSIAHVVDAPLAAGAAVQGVVDWARRFDHMQQHTGQHVLSAAFDRLFGVRTESFHLGTESATIDLAREVTAAELTAAEEDANRVVWEDRPVGVRFASAEEAASLPLRKEPARGGPLRLIDVADFDLSACGGTHVARTGGIGVIAVASVEKFRGGSRVEFLCGGRALRRFRSWRDALAASMRFLSVAPHELAGAIDRLQQDNKAVTRTARTLQEQLAVHEAAALVARGTTAGDRTVVVEALEGWDASGLKAMASAAAARPGVAVALFSTSTPALCVVARSQGVPVDAGAVLKALAARFGGKGGGKPDLAQGGGLNAGTEALIAEAARLLGA